VKIYCDRHHDKNCDICATDEIIEHLKNRIYELQAAGDVLACDLLTFFPSHSGVKKWQKLRDGK
jgi:hypothetical protein